jgi:hypothetical protein
VADPELIGVGGVMPGNSMADAARWAAGVAGPAYAIDDDTAIPS